MHLLVYFPPAARSAARTRAGVSGSGIVAEMKVLAASTSSSPRRKGCCPTAERWRKAASFSPRHTHGVGPCCPHLGRRGAHAVVDELRHPRRARLHRPPGNRSGPGSCSRPRDQSGRRRALHRNPHRVVPSPTRLAQGHTGRRALPRHDGVLDRRPRPIPRLRHPDAREQSQPPLLGLIQSSDAGETWQPISLYGNADFHVLRTAGDHVYGYDASSERLLKSATAAARGQNREACTDHRPGHKPARADPARRDRRKPAGEEGSHASRNGGRNWKRLSPTIGLLAWPTPNRLYLVDPSGWVMTAPTAAAARKERASRGRAGRSLAVGKDRALRGAARRHHQALDRRRRPLDRAFDTLTPHALNQGGSFPAMGRDAEHEGRAAPRAQGSRDRWARGRAPARRLQADARRPAAVELAAAGRRGDAGRRRGRDRGVRRARRGGPRDAALDFAWSTAATIEPLVEGASFFPRIFADVEAARASVHILMFGWREGEIGTADGRPARAEARRTVSRSA